MTTYANNNRLHYIDVAKSIGILLVVVGHHIKGTDVFVQWIYSFHMPLFFIISGYVFNNNKIQNFKSFLISKAKSLMYPYFTFSCISILWNLIYYTIIDKEPTYSFKHIILSYLSTYGYNALWFLPTLFFAFLIFYFVFQLKNKNIYFLIILSVALILNYLLPKYFYNLNMIHYIIVYLMRVLYTVFFIYSGSILKIFINNLNKNKFNIAIKILLLTVLIILSLLFFDNNPIVNLAVGRVEKPLLYLLNSFTGSI